jgi:hypothetical protein
VTSLHNRVRSRSTSRRLTFVDQRLTEEHIINHGGWHPRFARVLLIAEVGEEAFAIVDGNGDGAELELEQWLQSDEGWVSGMSSGIGPLDNRRGVWVTGWTGGVGYAAGGASPGHEIAVEWRGQVKRATANDYGVWLCLFPDQPPPRHAQMAFGPETAFGSRHLSVEEWEALRDEQPRIVDVP